MFAVELRYWFSRREEWNGTIFLFLPFDFQCSLVVIFFFDTSVIHEKKHFLPPMRSKSNPAVSALCRPSALSNIIVWRDRCSQFAFVSWFELEVCSFLKALWLTLKIANSMMKKSILQSLFIFSLSRSFGVLLKIIMWKLEECMSEQDRYFSKILESKLRNESKLFPWWCGDRKLSLRTYFSGAWTLEIIVGGFICNRWLIILVRESMETGDGSSTEQITQPVIATGAINTREVRTTRKLVAEEVVCTTYIYKAEPLSHCPYP